jgi:hypothetical protein
MSASLAAAKKRRAPAQPIPSPASAYPSPQTTNPVASGQAPGLTLPQVIQVVDKRLLILETSVKELASARVNTEQPVVPSNIKDVLDEFSERFNQLAEEVEGIKHIVLSLQSYTMDVNKMLLEERIQLLSGNGQSAASTPLENVLASENDV